MVKVNMDAVKNIFFWGFILVILYILITGKLTRDNVILILILILGAVMVDMIYRAFKKQSKKDDPSYDFPSDKYMDNVGGLCPDYWEVIGYEKNGNPICKNMFDVPVVPKTKKDGKQYEKCFDKESKDTKTFRRIKWPIDDDALRGSDHCKWVKHCGPADGARASWLGVDDKC